MPLFAPCLLWRWETQTSCSYACTWCASLFVLSEAIKEGQLVHTAQMISAAIRIIFLCYLCQISSALLNFKFNTAVRDIKTVKSELLELSRKVNKGLNETPADRVKITSLVEELEKKGSKKETLKDPALNAVWQLEYSTSEGTIGKTGPPKVGPILQTVDATRNYFENSDTIKILGLIEIPRRAEAELTTVEPPQRAYVKFQKFFIGPVPLPIRGSGGAFLDVTYVDQDIRLSRGNKGNIFVLSRYSSL